MVVACGELAREAERLESRLELLGSEAGTAFGIDLEPLVAARLVGNHHLVHLFKVFLVLLPQER